MADSERVHAVFRDVVSKDVLKAILPIHFPDAESVADLTWGKGAFWDWSHGLDVVGLDITPRYGCQIMGDARHTPFVDDAVDFAVLDPPFIWSRGKAPSGIGIFNDYSSFDHLDDLYQLYQDAAFELYRISRLGAIVKSADMVKHGRFHPNHAILMALMAEAMGWPEDFAILSSATRRPVRMKTIRHLRQSQSYFAIYRWDSKDIRSDVLNDAGLQ